MQAQMAFCKARVRAQKAIETYEAELAELRLLLAQLVHKYAFKRASEQLGLRVELPRLLSSSTQSALYSEEFKATIVAAIYEYRVLFGRPLLQVIELFSRMIGVRRLLIFQWVKDSVRAM